MGWSNIHCTILIPNPDVYGEFILYLCVNDGDNNTCSENIVVVNPVNDSPFITVEEAIFINEGEDLTLASMEQLSQQRRLIRH